MRRRISVRPFTIKARVLSRLLSKTDPEAALEALPAPLALGEPATAVLDRLLAEQNATVFSGLPSLNRFGWRDHSE